MQRLKATMIMVAAELVHAAFTISYKLAANDDMHMRILITYRYLFASILIFPVAFFLERKCIATLSTLTLFSFNDLLLTERNKRPKLTWTIFFQIIICATIRGPIAQNMYAKSLVLTSPTFTAAFSNLIPPFAFIVAVMFRLEKIEIRKISGKAKVIGTLVGVGGAMILTFYKGDELNMRSTNINILHGGQRMGGHVATTHKTNTNNHILGSLLALAYSLSVSLYYTFQSKLSVKYPCHYSNTFSYSVIGFIQSFAYAVLTERSWSRWKLNSNIRIFSVIFQGISSLLGIFFVMTVVHLQGPLFVSMFYPLVLVFVAIVGFLVLDEKLYVGSLVGSVIIIAGLYLVLWGKGKEIKSQSKPTSSGSSKDLNVASNAIATTTLESVSMACTSFPRVNVDDGDELSANPSFKQHEEREIMEEV